MPGGLVDLFAGAPVGHHSDGWRGYHGLVASSRL